MAERATAPRIWELYVGQLPPQTTEIELRHVFVWYADVMSTRTVRDRVTGWSAGYGFVAFGREECFENALVGSRGARIHGSRIVVASVKSEPSPVSRRPTPLWLGFRGLGMHADWKELFARFVSFGEVMTFRFIQCYGYGFVEYLEQYRARARGGRLCRHARRANRRIPHHRRARPHVSRLRASANELFDCRFSKKV